jgi:hypothetical protein
MFHGGEFFCAGPGDSEEEGSVGFGFDVVPDGVAEGEERSSGEVVGFAVDGDSDVAFEDLDGEGAVGVVLLHVCGVLHGDEDNAEVVFLEERFGVDARRPRFFLLGFGEFFGEIELGDLVDHGSVLHGGSHESLLSALAEKFTPLVCFDAAGTGSDGDAILVFRRVE